MEAKAGGSLGQNVGHLHPVSQVPSIRGKGRKESYLIIILRFFAAIGMLLWCLVSLPLCCLVSMLLCCCWLTFLHWISFLPQEVPQVAWPPPSALGARRLWYVGWVPWNHRRTCWRKAAPISCGFVCRGGRRVATPAFWRPPIAYWVAVIKLAAGSWRRGWRFQRGMM